MTNLINKLSNMVEIKGNYVLEGLCLEWVNKTQIRVSPIAWEGGKEIIYTPSLREYKWLLRNWATNYVTGAYEPWFISFED